MTLIAELFILFGIYENLFGLKGMEVDWQPGHYCHLILQSDPLLVVKEENFLGVVVLIAILFTGVRDFLK